jgi:hypothetical protein
MATVNNAIDMIKVAEQFTSAAHTSAVASAAEIASAEAIVNEELGHGMDRSRENIGYHDELNVYDRVASGSPSFTVVKQHKRSMQEMLIRMANPSELLIIGIPYIPLKLGIGNITLSNNLHLDYMERHMDISDLQYETISLADIESNAFPKTFDMASVHMPQVNHNFDIVYNIYDQLPSGGVIALTSSNDHGRLFEWGNSHDYAELFTTVGDRAGANLYHMSAGLGVSVITKAS